MTWLANGPLSVLTEVGLSWCWLTRLYASLTFPIVKCVCVCTCICTLYSQLVIHFTGSRVMRFILLPVPLQLCLAPRRVWLDRISRNNHFHRLSPISVLCIILRALVLFSFFFFNFLIKISLRIFSICLPCAGVVLVLEIQLQWIPVMTGMM